MAGTSPCPRANEWQRYLLGQTPAQEAKRFDRHLTDCPICLAAAESLPDTDALLDSVRSEVCQAGSLDLEVDEELIARMCRLRPASSFSRTIYRHSAGSLAGPSDATTDFADLLDPAKAADELGRIGPYAVLRVLGRGGMGVVFAARQDRPRRVVALKMIYAGARGGHNRLERFRAESDTLARLEHPNLVRVLEVGEHEGRPYFTMDYAEGGTLAQKLAVAPLPARAAAQLVEVLAQAIHFAHQNGVLHRDLKPANVLLGADGTPRVTDFGLAKQILDDPEATGPEYHTVSGALLGTPGYMAPEQVATDRGGEVGPATDVYGLGAVLYECLTGRPPFRAATLLETLDLVRDRDPVPPRQLTAIVPADLETICLACLRKEPLKRYASALELADDLGRFLRGEPIRARPVSFRERLLKWVRRNPALAALAAVSGLSLVALVAGSLIYQSRLRAAVERADTKAAEAQRQQERVEAGYQAAHDTLKRMLGRLESRRVSEVPQLMELQRALLEDSLAFYLAQLAGADDPDPAVRRDAALACRRAADIQLVMGRAEAARANYKRALALLEDLPPESRDAPENLGIQAGCWNNLATLADHRGRFDEVERYLRGALAIRERLARSRPDDPAIQNVLAESMHNLGTMYYNRRKWAEAEVQYVRGVTIRVGLVQAHPREEIYQAALSEDYLNLARVFQNTDRPTEASGAYEKADALLRPLADREPPAGRYTLSLIALYSNWGYLLAEANRSREALARLDEAVRRADAAYRQEPQHFYVRQRAVQAHGARAEVHEHSGNLADSVKDWDRVVELEEESARYDRRLTRARVLTGTGEHVRATAEADELAKRPEARGDNLIYLAQIYGLAIAPARGDAKLAPSEREARAERYGSSGVAMLRKLQEEGYFKDVDHLQLLRSDKRVRTLREREDFRRLLKQVEGTKK